MEELEVLVPDDVWEQIDSLQIREPAQRLLRQISANRRTSPFFQRGLQPLLKAKIGKCRLLAEECRDQRSGKLTVIIVAAMQRKSKSYETLWGAGSEQARDLLRRSKAELLQEGVAPWKDAPTNNRQEPVKPQPVPDDWHGWLNPARGFDSEFRVLESAEWVQAFQQSDVLDYWQTFHNLALQACDHIRDLGCQPGHSQIMTDGPRGIRFAPVAPFGPNHSGGVLLQRLWTSHESNAEQVEVTESVPDENKDQLDWERAVREARRGYSELALADEDLWLEIAKSSEANLALSPEEVCLLNGLLYEGSESGSGMPLFINGRAGSGKSTMLCWAFAHFCRESLRGDLGGGPPVYLTWSAHLLDRARDSVKSLLTANANFREDGPISKSSIEQVLDNNMLRLRDMLLQIARQHSHKEANRFGAFDADRFVSYSIFRNWIERAFQPIPKDLSAELCWHVIRVFIKGYYIDPTETPSAPSWFDVDDYEELPKGDRSVTKAVFEQVFRKVWPKYDDWTSAESRWDHQDLVRHVLTIANDPGAPGLQARFPAVFCDEAQDLTRLELQFLMGLSAFRGRDFSSMQYISRLPFVFAGDPMQTVHPTGFRWESFKAGFSEMVIRPIVPSDRAEQWAIRPNEKSLRNNYRSSQHIVEASNLVQLYRRQFFADAATIRPQETWHKVSGPRPVKVLLEENSKGTEHLEGSLGDAVVIVPCDEGCETQYLDSHPLLATLIDNEANAGLGNLFSPASAKGLEFPKVVLYGFGKLFESCNIEEMVIEGVATQSDAERLSLEYNFNKLYVGISRPTEALFILDTPAGNTALWSPMLEHRERVLEQAPAEWAAATPDQIMQGTSRNFAELSNDKESAAINAENLESYAESSESPEHFKRAAYFWKRADNTERETKCRAAALAILGKAVEASELYLSIGYVKQAIDALWNCQCWDDFISLFVREGQASSWRLELAQCMPCMPCDPAATRRRCEDFLGRHVSGALPGPTPDNPAWTAVVRHWMQSLPLKLKSTFQSSVKDKEEWERTKNILASLCANFGFGPHTCELAECMLRAGDPVAAIDLLGHDGHLQLVGEARDNFLVALAEKDGLPAGLRYLQMMSDEGVENIIDAWNEVNNKRGLTPQEIDGWAHYLSPEDGKCLVEHNVDDRIRLALFGGTPRWEATRQAIQAAVGNTAALEQCLGVVHSFFERSPKYAEVAANELAISRFQKRRGRRRNQPPGSLLLPWAKHVAAPILWAKVSLQEPIQEESREVTRKMLDQALEYAGHEAVPLPLHGAVLEAIGFHVDALKFYEGCISTETNPSRRTYWCVRWAMVKDRQTRLHAENSQDWNRLTSDYQRKVNSWNLTPTDLNAPSYPRKSDLEQGVATAAVPSPSAQPAQTIEIDSPDLQAVSKELLRLLTEEPEKLKALPEKLKALLASFADQ